MGKAFFPACISICPNRKFRKQVYHNRAPAHVTMNTVKVATVVQQNIRELSKTVLEKGKLMVIAKT
jgi:hypothetical protein